MAERKGHFGCVERKQLEVLTAKHGRSLRLLYTVGGDQAKLNGV